MSNSGGTGVTYNIKMENLPNEGGPFREFLLKYRYSDCADPLTLSNSLSHTRECRA